MSNNMPKPPSKIGGLTQSRLGFYGRFGSGGNVDVSYVQTVMDFDFLNNITLIEDIKGSDKWKVRDLFQRNVDRNRVEDEIVPFLKEPDSIKFFAPLALVLLPISDGEVNKELVEISNEDVIEDETTFIKHNLGDTAAFFEHKEVPAYSRVKWNPDKVKLVAVDGQHRISALKMLLDDEQVDPLVSKMNIPILVIGFSKSKNLIEGHYVPSLLDVVRQTFVYINNKSQKINESRAILLDNEDINCLAVQEVIQFAHDNDNNLDDAPTENSSNIPLVMFDWRGEEKKGRPISGPASLFSVRDVKDWFTEYLLGDVSGKGSEKAIREKIIPRLDLESMNARLNTEDLKGLNHKNSDIARNQVKKILIPSVIFMLENLDPFKKYINKIRKLQHKTNSEMSREGRVAYKWICFGKSKVKDSLKESDVDVAWSSMARDLGMLKSKLPTLLSRDIGIRAIWSSYSMLYDLISEDKKESQDWLAFSKWYLKLANEIINEGWFRGIDVLQPMVKDKREKLTHIVYTRSGEIVNYKLEASPKGFGAFIMMLILQLHGDQSLKEKAWDNLQDGLIATVSTGFRRDVKEQMEIDGFGGTPAVVREEAKRLLIIETSKWDNSMRSFFGI